MLREIAVPTKQDCILRIPKDYVNKKIEVIAFPVEDEVRTAKASKRYGFGAMKSKIRMSKRFDQPLDDFKEYMQ